jgi:hypothetical protein
MEHHRDTKDAAEREEWIIQLLRHKLKLATTPPIAPIVDNTIMVQLTASWQDGKTLKQRGDAALRRRLELLPTDPIDVELEIEHTDGSSIANIILRIRLML